MREYNFKFVTKSNALLAINSLKVKFALHEIFWIQKYVLIIVGSVERVIALPGTETTRNNTKPYGILE